MRRRTHENQAPNEVLLLYVQDTDESWGNTVYKFENAASLRGNKDVDEI